MSVAEGRADARRPSWLVPLLRALPALVAAAIVTFSPDHSARFGSVVFGGFALATAIVLAGASARSGRGAQRTSWLITAVAAAAAGVLALAVGGSLPFLLVVLSAWAAVSGFVELALGLSARRESIAARDWRFIGALTALFAIVVLVIPPDFAQPWTGPEGTSGVVTASVVTVGAFGAYAAIVGVFHVIAALSLRWAPTTAKPDATATPGATAEPGTKERATS